MDLFCDISNCIGTGDLSSEICQAYLDQPAGSSYDHSDVLVPNIDCETLNEIIKTFRSCKQEDLEDSSSIVYIKRFAAAALSTANNSSNADGASAYGVCNNNILAVISNYMGKLGVIALKSATKRLTAKEKEILEDKKMNKKQKDETKKLKKMKKNGKFDHEDEVDEEDGDSESDTDQSNEKESFSQFTQLSQLSQPFDEEEEIESSSHRRAISQVSYPVMKKFLTDIKANLYLYTKRTDDMLTDSCVDAAISVLFLSAVKPDYSGLFKDALATISTLGISNEKALLTVYRSLIPALTTAGRDVRFPDGSKVRVLCHKAAVQVMLSLIASSSRMTWWITVVDENLIPDRDIDIASPSREENCSDQEDNDGREEGSRCVVDSDEMLIISPEKCNNQDAKSRKSGSNQNEDDNVLPTCFICVVGALQRMTVNVPDKSNWRTLILNSIIRLLNELQTVSLSGKEEREEEQPPDRACLKARLAATKYLSFLQKLSKSNKIGFRAFSLDIITACMSEEWLWTIPLKITESECSKFVESTDSGNSKFYARSLLSMVLQRCSDVAPTVRIRALGALCGLLEKLKDKGHGNPLGMCSSVLDLALGFLEEDMDKNVDIGVGTEITAKGKGQEGAIENMDDGDEDDNNSTLSARRVRTCNLFEILRIRIDDDKPLVRAKAIQTFSAALGLDYPKFTSDDFVTLHDGQGKDYDLSEPANKDEMETVSMLITPDDVTLLFDRCGDQSLSTRKQALSSLSDLVLVRPACTVLQDAWVTGCLSMASDPESSVQIKLAQSVLDLIIIPSLSWAKKKAVCGDSDSSCVEKGLGWVLCCKISETGRSNLLKLAISTMLKQGLIKSSSGDSSTHSSSSSSSSNISVILKAVKTACCDESEIVSRGGWVLLEALIDNEDEKSLVTTNMEMTAPKSKSSGSSSADLIGSSNFVFDCFFKKQEDKLQFRDEVHGSAKVSVLDQDDERILKVFKKITDTISLSNLMKTKEFLLSVVQSLSISPSLCTVIICTLFAISKSIAKIAMIGSNSTEGIEKEEYLQKLWYADVTQWSGRLLLTVYRALHTAVWREELEESKLYDLFCTESRHHVKESEITRIPTLTQAQKEELVATFERTTKGEISMLGFSLDEDEGVAHTKKKETHSNSPTYTISEISKSFKIILPKKIISFTQMLMSTHLPASDDEESSSLTQNSSNNNFHDNNEIIKNHGKECISVIRAHAFVAMGKFCLRDKVTARSHVNVFLRELHSAPHSKTSSAVVRTSNSSVRSNALFVLGDMCVRYTNLVDRHIGVLAGCLQDSSVLVRKHALILLTQLLLQDYIKWRGLLLYRFFATVTDHDEEMAEFAKSVLKKTLSVKYPDFFAIHFSECLLVLNGCTDHPVFIAVASSGADGDSCAVKMDGVDLTGPRRRNARLRLYAFMMSDFSEEQKIQVTARIVHDMLAYAVDYLPGKQSRSSSGPSEINVHTPFEEALRDSFLVLQSPLLKVGRKTSHSPDVEEEEDLEEGGASVGTAIEKAKNKVLKKISLQHLLVHMLPVVTSLKHVLETNNSHLQRALMDYLVTFVKAHKAEVYQAMTLDPTLKDLRAEIDYEIKLFDKNGREKITRNRKSIDSVSFALEQSIEGASLNGEGGLVSQPMEESADNFKKRSLMTPSKQQQQQESERERASSTNPSLTGNNTPFKNIKGMAFPSPLKSSRSINTSSNERQLERSILTDAINEDCEDDKKKEEEDEEQASQTRLSRRRSWGVVVSNLCEKEDGENTENVHENLPARLEKVSSKSLNSRKEMKSLSKNKVNVALDVDFEVRFTPLKKKTSKC